MEDVIEEKARLVTGQIAAKMSVFWLYSLRRLVFTLVNHLSSKKVLAPRYATSSFCALSYFWHPY